MDFHTEDIIHVNRIIINVRDLSQQLHFYHTILGMPIEKQTDKQAILSVGTKGHEVVLKQLENGRTAHAQEAGLFHIAFLLDSVEQLGAFIKHIATHHIPIGGGDHLVSEAIYFNDAEGNGIEVYVDRDENKWQWKENLVKMDTLALNVDGILEKAHNSTWEGMQNHAQIGHLHLKTNDLEEGRTFYNELGFNVVSTLPQALFLSDKHYHHHLAINMWQSNQKRVDAENTYGLSTFNLAIPNVEEKQLETPEGLQLTINKK